MNRSKFASVMLLVVFLTVFLSGCTSVGTASSWPGASADEEIAYFSYNEQVYAIDGKNGSLIWRFPEAPDSKAQFYSPPALGNEIVTVGSYSNSLAALDRKNGVVRWQFDGADDRYVGSQLITDEYVYAPNTDKYIYALDQKGNLVWRFKTKGPNWSTPVTDGNKLFFTSMDHKIYALDFEYAFESLDIDSGGSRTLVSSPVWSVDLGAAVVADPVIDDNKIIAATVAGDVFAVDASNGNILWEFADSDEVGSIWGAPIIIEKAIFFGDESGNLFALDASSGKALWPTPYYAGAPLIAGGLKTPDGALFVTDNGNVFIIDEQKTPNPIIMLDTSIFSSPVSIDGKVILSPGTNEEMFKAINLDGNVVWNYALKKK